jgi:hypothetical protein
VLHPTAIKSLPFINAQQLAEISKLTTQVEQLHKEVSTQVSRQRRKQMETHNANTNLIQPNFHPGDYVLACRPQVASAQTLSLIKCTYVVDKVYTNHTLRSMIPDVIFITHVTRAKIYRNVDHDMRQEMSAMKLTAEHNPCIPYVVRQFGHLSVEKKTGNMFVCTKWVGFDAEEGTIEPLYEKWVDVPRSLTEHLQDRADAGDEMADKAFVKIAEFTNDMGDHLPYTTGDTNSPNKIYQKLLHVPHHPTHPY